ncbi:NIPSNAP family protein [Phyllobacterium sp. SYP-B3895]|uniref:NIPSNAP family protein n=1 Tax=Phyllobacterium sp. SYP-B3895 TaxID=2663240 RepID=UPI00129A0560|nr:NIPSNAP family protein [Phyllobacterium sp. SYP-B3895]MRG54538.1 NIPSNAP family protein [Phyllobacterium sp. SYP-B3895]
MFTTVETAHPAGLEPRQSPITELRRYRLHPGRRDELIALFDAEFIETQEGCGMRVIGQFRDLDDPDAFVWLRGFSGMRERHAALTAFYDGPVWARHRDAANATMLDSDDVLLLHLASVSGGFRLPDARPGHGCEEPPSAIYQALTYRLKEPAENAFHSFHRNELEPILDRIGDMRIAILASEPSENTFSRLPVRLGENVFVVFSRFADLAAHADFTRRLTNDIAWQGAQEVLESYLIGESIVARLSPTGRSALR